ncbi:alpha/beta hydrolase [Yersinia sp. Marseille-Q3913]|nr:alpha/beta hydrolase [Yersinia sp. Marseille-Q3913]
MKNVVLCLCFLLFFPLTSYGWQTAVTHATFNDLQRHRQLESVIYYPTVEQGKSVLLGDNAVFHGTSILPDATLAKGQFPLIVLSHGSGGNNTSLAWLADKLVQQGMVVVAANHPGSTTGNSIPAQSAQLWLQTEDLSFVISALQSDNRWKSVFENQPIGVIGHSKGGYSAIAALGATLSLPHFIAGCQQQPEQPNCQFYTQAGVKLSTLSMEKFEGNYVDKRLRFAIALDPAMVPFYQNSSLHHLSAPLLLINARYFISPDVALDLGGAEWVKQLNQPNMTAMTLANSGHFDFLPTCKSAARTILAEEDEDFICATPAIEREKLHQQVAQKIVDFLHQQHILR